MKEEFRCVDSNWRFIILFRRLVDKIVLAWFVFIETSTVTVDLRLRFYVAHFILYN